MALAFRRAPDGSAFMDKESTFTVRGLAIVLVFLNHFAAFQLQSGGQLDGFLGIFPYSGALAVGLFLFCSGYATYVSSNEAARVSSKWFLRRVLGIYLVFVLPYAARLLIASSGGQDIGGFKSVILGFLALRPLGNPVWYLEVQVSAYIVFALAFKAFKKHGELLLWACALSYTAAFFYLGFIDYWWNSAICFPAGVSVARHRRAVVAALRRVSIAAFALPALASLAVAYWLRMSGTDWPSLATALVGCFVVALLLANRRVGSRPLASLGRISLEIYVWHGVFMRLFTGSEGLIENPNLGLLAVLGATAAAALTTRYLVRLVTGRLREREPDVRTAIALPVVVKDDSGVGREL